MKLLPTNTVKQRLKIYNKILNTSSLLSRGLCFVIQYIIEGCPGDIEYYINNMPENQWRKSLSLQEFKLHLKYDGGSQPLKFKSIFYTDRDKWRLKVIKSCIALCEKS